MKSQEVAGRINKLRAGKAFNFSYMNNLFKYFAIVLLAGAGNFTTNAQTGNYSANTGHSHNDYQQNIPFLQAYYAGMGSIEADVFLKNGRLLVAHEEKETDTLRTLDQLYLKPIAELYLKNNGKIYPVEDKRLQLVIDIKARYDLVIPVLLKEIKAYRQIFDQHLNKNAVRIVISGDMPPPEKFTDYPDYIFFDGRPAVNYSTRQLQHIAMISDNLGSYASWNGKGTPTPQDREKLALIVKKAHDQHKPFRFWGTKDSPNTWLELEKLKVDWIGTDHPEQLQQFYARRDKLEYVNPKQYPVYQPEYKIDGSRKKVKNVILLIGDGMGLAQIQAGLTANFGSLNLSMFRHIGLSRTEAVNSDITDSAAGGTAMACGEKTNNRYIGVNAAGRPMRSIPDTLSTYGIKSGIISSGDITDATPAVFYAHQPERSMSYAIAADFAESHVDILVGSNRKSFTENPDKMLMDKLLKKGFSYAKSLTEFKTAKEGKQLVLLDDSVCRPVKDGRGDLLKTALEKTVSLLSMNKMGFFIMAEGAQIDYGGHANDLPYVVTELHDFDRTIGEAVRFADQDGETLVIVTADHETGGLSFLDASYQKGMIRGNFSTDDHTNIMVPVFAYGPGADSFMGIYKNTEIYHRIIQLISHP
jgi:alkaline phosphatase